MIIDILYFIRKRSWEIFITKHWNMNVSIMGHSTMRNKKAWLFVNPVKSAPPIFLPF